MLDSNVNGNDKGKNKENNKYVGFVIFSCCCSGKYLLTVMAMVKIIYPT